MRSFKHWTPRYIHDKIGVWLYQKKNPDAPWLTPDAIKILDSWLKLTDAGFEWGSGRSTLWFAARVSHITSIEHDEQWYSAVKYRLNAKGVKNVNLILASLDGEGESPYVHAIRDVENTSLDFVLVDGRLRSLCALAAISKIRPDGILVIDNINEYIACDSYAPGSRRSVDGPKDEGWAKLSVILSKYRRFWTSNGIFDTAVFVVDGA